MNIPSKVKRRIVVRIGEENYLIATLIIRAHKGELLYIPSQKGIKSPQEKEFKNLDHISFHADGLVHLKYKFSLFTYKTVRQFLPIKNMGYQEMMNDFVKNIRSLPKTSKSVNDIVFNVLEDNFPVHLNITLISGKVVIDTYESKETKHEKHNRDFIGSEHIAISNKIINTDKMLQIYLEHVETMKVPRVIFIPSKSNINNKNQLVK